MSLIMSSSVEPQRKRSSPSADTSEDPPVPGSLPVVRYVAPVKVRAVAGPSQEHLDQYREQIKFLMETNQRLAAQNNALVEQNQFVGNKLNELHQNWQDEMEVNGQLESMHQEEVHARAEVENSLCEAQRLREELELRLKEANDARDLVTRDKVALDAEIHRLRNQAKSSQPLSSSSQSHAPLQSPPASQHLTTPPPPPPPPQPSSQPMPPPPPMSSSSHPQSEASQFTMLPPLPPQPSSSHQQSQVPPQSSSSSQQPPAPPPPQPSASSSPHQQPQVPSQSPPNSQPFMPPPPPPTQPFTSPSSHIDLNAIIESTVARVMAARPAETPRRTRRSQQPKPGSPAYDRKLKRDALDKLTDSGEKDWNSFVRGSFLSMMQREYVNHFEDYKPVEEAVALACENYDGPGPENASRFDLFFGPNWRKSRWNRIVVSNMLPVIMYKKAELHLQGDLSDSIISAMLWDYIKQAQESWQRHNPRIAQDGNRVEMAEEAQLRADTQSLQRSVKTRRNSRKLTKFNKRKAGIEQILQQTSLTTSERGKWIIAQTVLARLGKDGQSTDESDTDGQGLHSTVPFYRRRFLSVVLQEVDNHVIKQTQKEYEQKGKRYTRRPALVRQRTEKKSSRTLVRKLPRSLYHQKYLNSLPPAVLKSLEIDTNEIPYWNEWVVRAMPFSDSEPEI